MHPSPAPKPCTEALHQRPAPNPTRAQIVWDEFIKLGDELKLARLMGVEEPDARAAKAMIAAKTTATPEQRRMGAASKGFLGHMDDSVRVQLQPSTATSAMAQAMYNGEEHNTSKSITDQPKFQATSGWFQSQAPYILSACDSYQPEVV